MSKAFTRESDDLPDPPRAALPASPLPPGVRNYLTPDGARRFREELAQLTEVERPRVLAAGTPEAKTELALLDRRIQLLQSNLRSGVVVAPPAPSDRQVRFGAWVTVREPNGSTSAYRIVGVDEADPVRGWISWLSPMAKALLKGRTSQTVRLQLPGGPLDLEIISIHYP